MTINFDVTDTTDVKEVRVLIAKHGGRVLEFLEKGPGGDNPNFTVDFPRSADARHDATAMMKELYFDKFLDIDLYDISDTFLAGGIQ